MASQVPLPASMTKHVDRLRHAFPAGTASVELVQQSAGGVAATRSDTSASSAPDTRLAGTDAAGPSEHGDRGTARGGTGTTGTTLWLGAQVMAAFVKETLGPGQKRVLELGGGVGYLALYLAHLGHSVTTTDVEPALSSVLRANVEANEVAYARTSGGLRVRQLDWNDYDSAPEEAIQKARSWSRDRAAADEQLQPFDTLITTDTIYHPALIAPLLATLRAFSCLAPRPARAPPILVALERRDPRLVDAALDAARAAGFDVRRVGGGRVAKCLSKAGWGSWLRVARCASVREGGCREEDEDEAEDEDEKGEDGERPDGFGSQGRVGCGGRAEPEEEELQPDRAAWEGVEIWNWRYVGPRPV